MEVNKLKSGQVFKNYKQLCFELEMEFKKSSNSRKSQFTKLGLYCKYEVSGHQISIKEVYEKPLMKIEMRGRGASNDIYGKLLQLLITDLLAQCKGHLNISRSKLLRKLNMVNSNYGIAGENVSKLSKYIDTPEIVIYDFYNNTNGKFKRAVERALNSLMDKRIILYDRVTKVSERETNIRRLATNDEKEAIVKIEKKVLEELGYSQMSDLRKSKDWRKFKTKVKYLILEKTKIDYYFLAYDITINNEYIDDERIKLLDYLLEEAKRNEYKDELNSTVYKELIANAEKRKQNAFTSKKMSRVRIKDTYIDDITKLATLLIDRNSRDITRELFNNHTLTQEDQGLMDEIEVMNIFGS